MVASADFVQFIEERLAPLGPITTWRMFGKTGVFLGGVMFGMADNEAVEEGRQA